MKFRLKLYGLIFTIILAVLLFGFVIPFLISSQDDLYVIAGLSICVIICGALITEVVALIKGVTK